MKSITQKIIFCLLVAAKTASADAQIVTSGADDSSPGTLRSQIAAAAGGSTVTFAPDVTSVVLTGEITIDKTLTITGNGVFNTTIDGNAAGRIFNITAGTVAINGITLTNGLASDGGAIRVTNANLQMNNAAVTNSIANGATGSGGALFIGTGATLTALNTSFTANRANRAGGAVESAATTVVLTSCNFTNNNAGLPPAVAAPGNGGGLHITGSGNATVTGGTFFGNTAALEGGGLWNGNGTMALSGVFIGNNEARGNAADDGGGGIFNNAGTVNLTNSTTLFGNLAKGTSGSGGGLLSLDGTVTVTNSALDSNAANRAGGGIEIVNGILGINFTIIINNDVDGLAGTPNPGNGGAIHISGIADTTIQLGFINDNHARREGGALWNQTGSTMLVDDTNLDRNIARGPSEDHGGGAIFNNGGTLTVSRSTLFDNSTDGALGNGGAIHVKSGSATVTLCTLTANDSENNGGGIYNNGALTVNASTIVSNSSGGNGGGIANNSATVPAIGNTIVAFNSSTGGNAANLSSTTGVYASNGYNIIFNDPANAFTPSTGDMEGVNPLIGSLEDNGGFHLTHRLLANSPAYNAGNPADPYADELGNPVFGGRRDIGALESQTPLLGIGQSEMADDSVTIYPNPSVTGTVGLYIKDPFGGEIDGKIIGIGGKIVREFKAFSGFNEINAGDLAPGIYLLRLSSGDKAETHKLIIGR